MKQRKRQPVRTRGTIRLWPDAGNHVGLSRGATYAAAQRGDIPAVKVGGLWIVPIDRFEAKFGKLRGDAA